MSTCSPERRERLWGLAVPRGERGCGDLQSREERQAVRTCSPDRRERLGLNLEYGKDKWGFIVKEHSEGSVHGKLLRGDFQAQGHTLWLLGFQFPY